MPNALKSTLAATANVPISKRSMVPVSVPALSLLPYGTLLTDANH